MPSDQNMGFPIGTIPRSVYATSSGGLTLFLNMQDLLNLYQLYRMPPNAAPVLLNETAVTIAGEVLWATDDRGALVVTDHAPETWEERPLGALQWVSATDQTTAKLNIRGHYLRWGKP